MPKLPKAPRYKPHKAIEATPKGRRSIRRAVVAVVPTVLTGSLLLSGCSAADWPDFSSDSSASPTTTPAPLTTELPKDAKDALPPVVTVPQLQNIVAKISTLAATTDANLNANQLATRFTGPALALRKADYAIRAKKPDEPALQVIPAGPLEVTLPQATDSWPRVVETVVQNTGDATAPPIALVLVQDSPRDNYKVNDAITLEPDAKVPDLAPASIGTSIVPPDTKLLVLPPDKLADAYADVLLNGDKSTSARLFDATSDTLRTQVAKLDASARSQLSKTASLSIATAAGSEQPISLATNDSGAIVAVNVTETQTAKIVQDGAEVTVGTAAAALAGVGTSKKGFDSTFGYQLLFYVPAAESTKKITLLGFSQGLIAASEIK